MSLEATQHYLKQAAKKLELSQRLQRLLYNPYRVVKTNVAIELDNGEIASFMAYRVQHNNALGPMKGGLRYHPEVHEAEVESLASLMTWKTSLLQLPFGGAKGGITCNPGNLSDAELERLTKTFTDKIKEIIGPYIDIPAPDVNTNPQIMAWILAEYNKHYGHTPAVVTGKPLYLHGCDGRNEATGKGVSLITDMLLNEFNKSIKKSTFVIQGFGNVGSFAAHYIHELGGKIIAVSDVNGGIYNQDGLDVVKLHEHVVDHHTVTTFPNGKMITNEELLRLKCEVLIPAALGNVFTKEVAKEVQCKFIVEGANGPTLPEADEIFNQRNIIVVPDILANAAGVVVSYFEWVQNIQQFKWLRDRVDHELERFMTDAFLRVTKMAKAQKCNYRTAAYIIGLGRVAKASLTLGL